MPAYQYKFKYQPKHALRPQYEIDLFNEFVSRVVNVYESVKHLNPPKEKVIAAAIEQYRVGAFRVTGWKGRPLPDEITNQRIEDYMEGLTDKELATRWGISLGGAVSWRYCRGLKPNKRG